MTEDNIGRREALWRASLLVGGVVVIPGALAGCDRGDGVAKQAATGGARGAWAPRTLSPQQAETVATIGEYIIPRTNTPGARDARVQEFVDTLLTDFMPPKQRARLVAGLDRVDQRARRAFGRSFLEATPDQQRQLVTALNDAAYADPSARFSDPRMDGKTRVGRVGGTGGDAGGADEVGLQEGEVASSRSLGGGAAGKAAADAPGGVLDAEDVGRDSFFVNLKRLVIEGYYTSEVGATQELRVNPMGTWRADIPYPGHAWA